MKTEAPAYKRIVLKLSGEAMQERGGRDNISPAVVREIAVGQEENELRFHFEPRFASRAATQRCCYSGFGCLSAFFLVQTKSP